MNLLQNFHLAVIEYLYRGHASDGTRQLF